MVKVLIKKLSSEVQLPSYKTSGASGMDLMAFIKTSVTVKPKTSLLIPTGLSIAFSEDYEVQIRPRSGLAAKSNISVLNTPGTIDSDYRGEIKILLINFGSEPFLIRHRERIAQLVICPIIKGFLEVETNFSKTDRNELGFGSTGTM